MSVPVGLYQSSHTRPASRRYRAGHDDIIRAAAAQSGYRAITFRPASVMCNQTTFMRRLPAIVL
jgi:hypothetical protein